MVQLLVRNPTDTTARH